MNIADMKKELSNDEKMLESVFKLETLYRKYKYLLWAVAIIAILFFLGRAYMHSIYETKMAEANEAFLVLQKNPKDKSALFALKEKNPKLFELFTYAQAAKNKNKEVLQELSRSHNEIIADASTYASSVLELHPRDSKLYRQMTLFVQAYLAIKEKNFKEAREKLVLIEEGTPLYMLASLLKHSIIKAK